MCATVSDILYKLLTPNAIMEQCALIQSVHGLSKALQQCLLKNEH